MSTLAPHQAGPKTRRLYYTTMQYPTYTCERQYLATYTLIAGVDEAGRGPLAGPVVAGAVILEPAKVGAYRSKYKWWRQVADSKIVAAKTRRALFDDIKREAMSFGIGEASVSEIDELNIHCAALLAMKRAIANCGIAPQLILIDGRSKIDGLDCRQIAIVKGDAKVLSIAAASIVAKVTRDEIMDELHAEYPQYGFDQHRGYATRQHREMIAKHGPCPIHRQSFLNVIPRPY